jgi:hypothetical protein
LLYGKSLPRKQGHAEKDIQKVCDLSCGGGIRTEDADLIEQPNVDPRSAHMNRFRA